MSEQLQHLVAAMELLPDGILVVDEERKIAACNKRLEALFGYSPGELNGAPLSVLVPTRSQRAHHDLVTSYLAGGSSAPMTERPTIRGVTKEGRHVPLSICLSRAASNGRSFAIAVVRDARSFDDTLDNVKLLAEVDPLTELRNRRFLASRFATSDPRIGGARVGMLYLDLDSFKPLNDRYGHEVGDKVLRIVAQRMRRSLREEDTCVRLGGDEFVVVLAEGTTAEALEQVALKLHRAITAPMRVGTWSLEVGVSIGGAISNGHSSDDRLLKLADRAMYDAKRTRKPYCFGGELAPRSVA